MEAVDLYRVNTYGWDCPCGQGNLIEGSVEVGDTVFCEDCGKEFEVESVEM